MTSKRKIIGVVLILVGFLALVTPFTPGAWLIFVGLEILGIRFLFLDKIKLYWKKYFKKENTELPK